MIQKKDWLVIAIFTLLTVIGWIAAEVYHASSDTTITETEQRLVEPLNPKLNPDTIKLIEELK